MNIDELPRREKIALGPRQSFRYISRREKYLDNHYYRFCVLLHRLTRKPIEYSTLLKRVQEQGYSENDLRFALSGNTPHKNVIF